MAIYWWLNRVYDKLVARGVASSVFYDRLPSVDEFLDNVLPFGSFVWPSVRYDLKRVLENPVNEAVKIDGIGSGKSTFLHLSIVLTLYWLTHLRDPARVYGLAPGSPIGIVIMSLRQLQAREIVYEEAKRHIFNLPWFTKHCIPTERKEMGLSILKFPGNVFLLSGGAAETIPTGFNIILGCADEQAWYIKRSLKGEDLDQAANVYHSLVERIETRFDDRGLIELVTSARTSGLFAETRYEAVKEMGEHGYATRRALWEAKPGKWAPYFVVSRSTAERLPEYGIVDSYDPETEPEDIKHVPLCFQRAYDRNPRRFLRDRASVLIQSTKSFVLRLDLIRVNTSRKNPVLPGGRLAEWLKPKPGFLYYIHTDLGLKRDKAAMAMGHQEGFLTVIDLVYVEDPRTGGVVDLGRIREIIYELARRGFRFGYITFDQFASTDSIQILTKRGYSVGIHSVDRTPHSYETWLEAHYDDLIDIYPVEGYLECARSLVVLPNGKIDHTVGGQKDITDAVAGVTFHCRTMGVSSSVSVRTSIGRTVTAPEGPSQSRLPPAPSTKTQLRRRMSLYHQGLFY